MPHGRVIKDTSWDNCTAMHGGPSGAWCSVDDASRVPPTQPIECFRFCAPRCSVYSFSSLQAHD
eukprot:4357812-Prymnesium_polylepis.1